MTISIDRFDHVVITVRDLEASLAFYSRVLGMRVERRPNGRVSLHFGNQKFNVHPAVNDIGLKARHPTLGSFRPTTPIHSTRTRPSATHCR